MCTAPVVWMCGGGCVRARVCGVGCARAYCCDPDAIAFLGHLGSTVYERRREADASGGAAARACQCVGYGRVRGECVCVPCMAMKLRHWGDALAFLNEK
jgi:hypothetical protein